jgi:Membrane bound FAD containing D-sorbitol dehydrogenase
VTDLTRRKMLGVAAATATGAMTSLSTGVEAATPGAPAAPAPNPLPDPNDLGLFVALSAALTGIAAAKLAPTVDPIQVKNDYFNAASVDPGFPALLQIIRSDPNPAAAANKVMNDPKLKYLGRSIILAWYLGVWYDPDVLKRYNTPNQKFPVPVERVISPAAYTQGWTWRVAQAHPMGYSELRYGYWGKDPLPLQDYV